jgi:hypothetical protein
VDMIPVPVVQRIKVISDVMYEEAREILHKKLDGIEDETTAAPVSRDVISTLRMLRIFLLNMRFY